MFRVIEASRLFLAADAAVPKFSRGPEYAARTSGGAYIASYRSEVVPEEIIQCG